MQEFIQVFGQRYIGLVDNINLYNNWRIPRPEAPYPQDYIIDQNGYVRYWSDEYDPKEIINVIDRLLATGIEEFTQPSIPDKLYLSVYPNPAKSRIIIKAGQSIHPVNSQVKIYNSSGQLVDVLKFDQNNSVIWYKKVPNGVYFVILQSQGQVINTSFIIKK